jgi:hypothetical protein
MKTYAVRTALRTPVQCQVSCFADGAVINGIVWDLSTTGWRATMDRPVPLGLEKSVFMTLRNGKDCHPIFLDAAIVRWTTGCDAGWEIMGIDELTQTRLTDFLEQCERKDLPSSGVLKETHCNVR